jgi:hypothetical protein
VLHSGDGNRGCRGEKTMWHEGRKDDFFFGISRRGVTDNYNMIAFILGITMDLNIDKNCLVIMKTDKTVWSGLFDS